MIPVGMKKVKHDKHLNTSGESSSTICLGTLAEGSTSCGLFGGSLRASGLTVLFLFLRMTLRVMQDLQLGQ